MHTPIVHTHVSMLVPAEEIEQETIRPALRDILKQTEGDVVWVLFRSLTGDVDKAWNAIQCVFFGCSQKEVDAFSNAGHTTDAVLPLSVFIGFRRQEFLAAA